MCTIYTHPGRVPTNEDIGFRNLVPRRNRRQSNDPLPVFSSSLESLYTESDRELCENDTSCLFDLVVTSSQDFAMNTLDSGKNSTEAFLEISKHNRCFGW